MKVNNCLEPSNPRVFSEVVATIILAHEQAPRCGRHELSFEQLQAVNPRWRDYPAAGKACLSIMNRDKINLALSYITNGLYVSEPMLDDTATVVLDWVAL